MKNKILIYAIIVILSIGLLWFADVSRDKKVVESPSLSPMGTTETLSQQSDSVDMGMPEIVNKYPPAECSIGGSITYLEPGLYENKKADIVYKNIDSVARHILWTISPQDDFSVGPNLFATLPVPNGTEDVTIGLPKSPNSKNYTLTAKVTYGRYEKGNLEIKEASCSGQIPVEIKF